MSNDCALSIWTRVSGLLVKWVQKLCSAPSVEAATALSSCGGGCGVHLQAKQAHNISSMRTTPG